MSDEELIDDLRDFVKSAERIKIRMADKRFTGANEIRAQAEFIDATAELIIAKLKDRKG